MTLRTLVRKHSNPAYTGANRCLACTVVNAAIAAAVGAGLSVVASPLVGLPALIGMLAVISLRGYLVPGTPRLTKRYLPDRVLRWFDKAPTGDALDGIDPEAYLRRAGAVELTPDGDLAVTQWMRAELADGVAELADDEALAGALADALGLDPVEVTVGPRKTGYGARVGEQPAGYWESRVALAADLAAHRTFERRVGGWRALPADTRSSLLGALRLCLDTCPACDGTVSLGTSTAESCCRTYEVLAATCDGCDARLFELDAALAGVDVEAGFDSAAASA
jgi:hypothetical protein